MGPKRSAPTDGTGIADALFFGVQQRVLGALFGNPDQSFYVNELMRLTGSGKGALLRELERLVGAGLVSARTIGNQKHYQASRDSPIFEELRGIVVKTFGVADVLREALLPLAKKIRAAFVYGSVAKGTATAASDVDLFVLADHVSYVEVVEASQAAERRLGREVNPTLYPIVELRKKAGKDGFVRRVLDGDKIFVIGSQQEVDQARQEPAASQSPHRGAPASRRGTRATPPSERQAFSALQVSPQRLRALCRRYRISKLSVFGSAARGELKPASDVDLMVEFDPGKAPSLWDFPGMERDFSKLFGGRKVDFAPPEVLDNPHRRRTIQQDLKVLYGA